MNTYLYEQTCDTCRQKFCTACNHGKDTPIEEKGKEEEESEDDE